MPKQNFLFLLATVGLVVCLIIHFLALTKLYVTDNFAYIFVLFLGVFAVFATAVLKISKISKNRYQGRRRGIRAMREKQNVSKGIMKEFWNAYPNTLKLLLVAVAAYGFINFFVMANYTKDGHANYEDGQYYIENKGERVREITAAEYTENKSYSVRLMTGHLAIFYAVSMMFHYKGKGKVKMVP